MTMAGVCYLTAGQFAAEAFWTEALNWGFAGILTTSSLSPWMPRLLPAMMASLNLSMAASIELDLGWHDMAGVGESNFSHLAIVGLWMLVLAIVPGYRQRSASRRV